tara:strand:- start:209 stop:343 length:135 start_codon:yes stop_codon:yes gene_type:complete
MKQEDKRKRLSSRKVRGELMLFEIEKGKIDSKIEQWLYPMNSKL